MQTAAPPVPTPKRSKRRWFFVGGFALCLLAVPFVYSAIADRWSEYEFEQLRAEIEADDPHWQWEDLIAQMPPAPDDQNAFVQIRKVSGLLKKTPFAIAPPWDEEKPRAIRNARLSAENAALLLAAFAPLDPELLAEARKLKDFPNGRLKIDPAINPFELMLHEIQAARAVMYLLSCDTMLRAHDNDFEGAVQSWRALLNAAHAIEDHPMLISQGVRISGQAIALDALEQLLGQGELSEPDLIKIQALLRREANENLLYHGVRGERAMGRRMYTDLRDGKITMARMMTIMGVARPGVLDDTLELFPTVFLRGHHEYLRLLDEQVKASKLKEEDRIQAMRQIEQKARDSRHLITRILLPATSKYAQTSNRNQAQLRCAMVAVAAERYRMKYEGWPRGFDDLLKEGWLTEIPHDPFDGKPLRFQGTPTGIVLYSVGFDKIDNQGKLNRANPHLRGVNLGFELWDRQFRAIQPPVEQEK